MKHRNLLLGLLAGALVAGGGTAAVHFRRAPLRALRSPDYAVCANAIVEVAEAGRADAVPYLTEILGSRRPSPVPGWNARWGLLKLGVSLTDEVPSERRSVGGSERPSVPPTLQPSDSQTLQRSDAQTPRRSDVQTLRRTDAPTPPDLINPILTLERISVDEGAPQVFRMRWKLGIPLGCPFRVLPASPGWTLARRYGVPRGREIVANGGFPPPHVRIAVYRREPGGDSGSWVHHSESWRLSLEEGFPPDAGGEWEATEDLVPPPGPGPGLAVVEVPALRIEDLAPDCAPRRAAGIAEGAPLGFRTTPCAGEVELPGR